ncbi:MAG: hypothetical protein WBA76_04515 [Phormidesmis sp.]
MNDLVPVSQTVLIALAVGLGSGTVAGCLDIAIDRFWLKQDWCGRSAAIKDVSLQAAIYGLFIGVGAFVFAILNPYGPSEKINPSTLYICIAYGFITPIGNLISKRDRRRASKHPK